MRKLLISFLCTILLCGCVFAQSDRIAELNTRIVVDDSGVRHVTAVAVIEFSEATTSFLFPLGENAEDIIVNGGEYELCTIDGVKCVRFTNPSGFMGRLNFLCSYTLPCTMTENLSGQQITLRVPERGWEYAIDRYSLTVDFPVDIEEFPRWESSYYGDEIDNYLHIQIKEGTVQAVSNTPFRDHETVTMKLQFPEDSFTLRHLAAQTISVDRVVFYLLLLLCVAYWFFRFRGKSISQPRENFFHRIREKLFDRNKNSGSSFPASAGEIPCQISNSLPDMAGLIAHWGNLGYILLRRTRRGGFRLEKQMDMGNECSSAERRLFREIFRTLSLVDLSGVRFRTAFAAEAPVLRAYWKLRMFRRNMGKPRVLRFLGMLAGMAVSVMIYDLILPANPSRWVWLTLLSALSLLLYWLVQKAVRSWYAFGRWVFMGLGLVATVLLFLLAGRAGLGGFMFLTILLQCFCSFVTRFGGKHSPYGEEAVEEILGFGKFVSHVNGDSARALVKRDPQYFYRTLPYAEILGMDKRFVKHFAPVTTETCPWIVDERKTDPKAEDFYELYKELIVLLRFHNTVENLRSKLGVRTPAKPSGGSTRKSASSSPKEAPKSASSRTSRGAS